MTKAEAIKIFEHNKKILSVPNAAAERQLQAIDAAIEALKAQDRPIICPRCGRTFAESEGRDE